MIWAVRENYLDVVRELLNAKADVNSKNKSGDTALTLLRFDDKGHLKLLGELIGAKVKINVNIQNNCGNTALIEGAGKGYCEAVERLIRAGADANIRNKNGVTALIRASGGGHTNVVRMLLEAGANADIKDGTGDTAHSLAFKNGYYDVVGILVSNGERTDIQNNSGETPGNLARKRGHGRASEKLKNNFTRSLKVASAAAAVVLVSIFFLKQEADRRIASMEEAVGEAKVKTEGNFQEVAKIFGRACEIQEHLWVVYNKKPDVDRRIASMEEAVSKAKMAREKKNFHAAMNHHRLKAGGMGNACKAVIARKRAHRP